jgi:hypothetical protein
MRVLPHYRAQASLRPDFQRWGLSDVARHVIDTH